MNTLTRFRNRRRDEIDDRTGPATEPVDRDETVVERERPIDRDETVVERERPTDGGRTLLRAPRLAPLAPFGGWLAAWGAAIVAASALNEAGVDLGLGFGIANGSVDVDAGFWAGLWTLVIQAGAFVVGGYVAGRMARARGLGHAFLAWFVAMAVTAADAIVAAIRDGGSSVLAPLRLPYWADLSYDSDVAIPLVIFAAGALIGALIGGMIAAGANRSDTTGMTEYR